MTRGPKPQKYYYEPLGKKMTITELAELPGVDISAAALRNRLDRGWSLMDAVNTPKQKNRSTKHVMFRGVDWLLYDLVNSEFNTSGMDQTRVYNRIFKYHWSVEDAITKTSIRNKDKGRFNTGCKKGDWRRYDYFGSKLTIGQLAKLPCCVVEQNVLHMRLVVLKWDLYKALTFPKYPKNRYSKNMTEAEREYWDKWLATPMEIIRERSMKFWEEEQKTYFSQSRYGFGHKL